jgi:hypothetical protein
LESRTAWPPAARSATSTRATVITRARRMPEVRRVTWRVPPHRGVPPRGDGSGASVRGPVRKVCDAR